MTLEETKNAFYKSLPVVFSGIRYNSVSALIYRRGRDKLELTVELEDRCGHCVVIAAPEKVEVSNENQT